MKKNNLSAVAHEQIQQQLQPHERKEYLWLRKRRSILLQGMAIVLIAIVRFAASFALPVLVNKYISEDSDTLRLNLYILSNSATLLAVASHPIVYWTLNARVQKGMRKFLTCRKRDKTTTVMPNANGVNANGGITIELSDVPPGYSGNS